MAADCMQRTACPTACCHRPPSQHRSVIRRRPYLPSAPSCQLFSLSQGLRNGVQARADPGGKAERLKKGAEHLQEDAKEQANTAMDEFEDSLESKPASEVLGSLVGVHEFEPDDMDAFRGLARNMRGCSVGLIGLAASMVGMVLLGKAGTEQVPQLVVLGVTISRVANIFNALLVSALIWLGSISFRRVPDAGEDQLALAFQGIIQMGIIFAQVAPITLSFAIISMLEAGIRWPGVTTFTAITIAAATALRSAGLVILFGKYTPGSPAAARALQAMRQGWAALKRLPKLDQAALAVTGGVLVPFSAPEATSRQEHVEEGEAEDDGGEEEGEEGSKAKTGEYEFSAWEERVLQVVMDSLRMAGLATALHALASILLGLAVLRQSGPWSARTYFMNDLVDQSIRSWLLFSSAGCFSAILSTRGKDITLMLQGLGAKEGLGLLFKRMRSLAWGMALFRSLDLSITLLLRIPACQRIYQQGWSYVWQILGWARSFVPL